MVIHLFVIIDWSRNQSVWHIIIRIKQKKKKCFNVSSRLTTLNIYCRGRNVNQIPTRAERIFDIFVLETQ